MATAIMVISEDGRPIREYQTVTQCAIDYRVSDKTVKEYINSGKLFPRGNVFFDYAIERKGDR